jgi:hypothetical protein
MNADSNWARAQGAREVVSAVSIGENGRFLVPKRQRVAVVGATRATHQSKVDGALGFDLSPVAPAKGEASCPA